jgi:hypothetical protein
MSSPQMIKMLGLFAIWSPAQVDARFQEEGTRCRRLSSICPHSRRREGAGPVPGSRRHLLEASHAGGGGRVDPPFVAPSPVPGGPLDLLGAPRREPLPVSSGRECPGWRGIETSTTVSPTAAPEARPLCQPAGGGFVTTITHVDRLAGGRSDRAGTYAILLFRFVGARSTLRPLGRPRGGAQPEANEGKRTCRDSYELVGVDAPSRWRSWLLRWRR